MELRDVDLNLLVVFNQFLAERRVNAVAQSLGITQLAVSNALSRLRRLLGDELFLRTSRGMEPTPFAEQLAEPVAYALGTLHSALNQRVIRPCHKHACLRARDDGHRGDLFPAAPHGTAGTHRTQGVDKHGAKCDREPERRHGGRPCRSCAWTNPRFEGRLLPAPPVPSS